MAKVNAGAIGSYVYYWVVVLNNYVETPSGFGLFATHGEAQDAADKLNARAK